MLQRLEKFVESPYVNFISGLVLVYTSGLEVFDSLDQEFKLGLHHGVLIFGILQILKTLPEFVEGSKSIREGKTKLK